MNIQSRRFLPSLLTGCLIALICVMSFFNFSQHRKQTASKEPSAIPEKPMIAKAQQDFKNSLEDRVRVKTLRSTLTDKQVNAINDFVGANAKQVEIEELPSGGKKIKLNQKYRHALVVNRSPNGELTKIEIGPSGFHGKN